MATQVIAEPRKRGFLCLNAHPAGCAANVQEQIDYATQELDGKLNNVLVIGSSTGYGLASTISACFGLGANTLGVCFERPSDEKRGGSAGWYNVCAAHAAAKEAGQHLETLNIDAFAHESKQAVIDILKDRYGKLDLIIYSLASPKRKDPDSDTLWSSVLKPIGETFRGKNINLRDNTIEEVEIEPATDEEIEHTKRVMGGDDWRLWIEALCAADVLNDGCRSVAYSYIGPKVTHALYRSGTIGNAKEDLEAQAKDIHAKMQACCNGSAMVSVNKALVTQASSAIPVVTLYTSILYKVMKEAGNHEGCIEQIVRLFKQHIGPGAEPSLDEQGRIRMDDLELSDDIQSKVDAIWPTVTTENLRDVTDFNGFEHGFDKLFGFGVEGVDYTAEVDTNTTL